MDYRIDLKFDHYFDDVELFDDHNYHIGIDVRALVLVEDRHRKKMDRYEMPKESSYRFIKQNKEYFALLVYIYIYVIRVQRMFSIVLEKEKYIPNTLINEWQTAHFFFLFCHFCNLKTKNNKFSFFFFNDGKCQMQMIDASRNRRLF
jgi:hypothetical protein